MEIGLAIYLFIGIALLTYSSVRQYQRDKEGFVKNSLCHWMWWLVTIGCVVLWPVLVVLAICEAICILKEMYGE